MDQPWQIQFPRIDTHSHISHWPHSLQRMPVLTSTRRNSITCNSSLITWTLVYSSYLPTYFMRSSISASSGNLDVELVWINLMSSIRQRQASSQSMSQTQFNEPLCNYTIHDGLHLAKHPQGVTSSFHVTSFLFLHSRTSIASQHLNVG